MVYEVALLYRIREAFLATGDARGAVRTGLRETAGAATGAAAVMLAAVIPFAMVDLLSVQVFGVGVAIAILLDALIVRPVLLPAAASLLGRWSWWPLSREAPPSPPRAAPAAARRRGSRPVPSVDNRGRGAVHAGDSGVDPTPVCGSPPWSPPPRIAMLLA